VWLVPSDFGSALQGFTKLLGAPGEDGVFRYTPSPVEPTPAEADDAAEVADWFETAADPAIAQAVAKAEADARDNSAPAITGPSLDVSSTEIGRAAGAEVPPPGGTHRA